MRGDRCAGVSSRASFSMSRELFDFCCFDSQALLARLCIELEDLFMDEHHNYLILQATAIGRYYSKG